MITQNAAQDHGTLTQGSAGLKPFVVSHPLQWPGHRTPSPILCNWPNSSDPSSGISRKCPPSQPHQEAWTGRGLSCLHPPHPLVLVGFGVVKPPRPVSPLLSASAQSPHWNFWRALASPRCAEGWLSLVIGAASVCPLIFPVGVRF